MGKRGGEKEMEGGRHRIKRGMSGKREGEGGRSWREKNEMGEKGIKRGAEGERDRERERGKFVFFLDPGPSRRASATSCARWARRARRV